MRNVSKNMAVLHLSHCVLEHCKYFFGAQRIIIISRCSCMTVLSSCWQSSAEDNGVRFCSTLQGRLDSACSRTDGFHPGPFEPLLRPVPSHLRGNLSLMPPGSALAALTARARRPLILWTTLTTQHARPYFLLRVPDF